MTTKQKFSITFLYVAMLLTLVHAIVPHHHHGNLICFNPKCVQECCHHHHHDGEEPLNCSCAHHHHESDECTVFTPYILGDDARDIANKISADRDNCASLSVAILIENTICQIVESSIIHFDFIKAPPLPVPDAYAANTRRGPPAA